MLEQNRSQILHLSANHFYVVCEAWRWRAEERVGVNLDIVNNNLQPCEGIMAGMGWVEYQSCGSGSGNFGPIRI